MDGLFEKKINVAGTTSHLGNWEWVALSMGMEAKQTLYGLYKPLTNRFFNQAMIKNRSRMGTHLLPAQSLKKLYPLMTQQPFVVGMIADQAPHYYPKAVQVKFLGQDTYFFAGPGLMVAQKQMVPIFGWLKRTGRSQYLWGVDLIDTHPPANGFTPEDEIQIKNISEQHQLSPSDAQVVFIVTQNYARRLEAEILAAPAEWLWSHRRWKKRPLN